jgi:predicted TIM-barrel fold metal-dependent hydrolase
MMANATAQAVPNSSGTQPPTLKAPQHAADCHIHIYDARFQPPVPHPQNGSVKDYRLLQKRLGVERVVIVQPRNYATDNSATLDAIAQLGLANARGVGVVRPEVADAELKRLDAGGIRGIRFTTGNPATRIVSPDMIEPLAKRIAPLGWHVQLNMPAAQIVEHADTLRRLPTPIVFDHMGQPPRPNPIQHPSHKIILELLGQRRAWVKISGAPFNSDAGPPVYADATELAQSFVKAAPERVVWGSDWPHPTEQSKTLPDDALLFDLLLDWAPGDGVRRRILVENPAALYRFE